MQLINQKRLEIEAGVCVCWSEWGIPFGASWWGYKIGKSGKFFDFNISLLCFKFYFQCWRWDA